VDCSHHQQLLETFGRHGLLQNHRAFAKTVGVYFKKIHFFYAEALAVQVCRDAIILGSIVSRNDLVHFEYASVYTLRCIKNEISTFI
jgi:hypothetical protein